MNSLYLLNNLKNVNEILSEGETYHNIKSNKKPSTYPLS